MIAVGFAVVVIGLVIAAFVLWFGTPAHTERSAGLSDSWCLANFFIGLAAVVFVCTLLLPTGIAAGDQITTNNAITQTFSVEKINTRKANALIPQFKSFLAEQYPQYEQQVFHDISHPGDVSLFFARYPELHASQSLADLVNRIDKLNSAIYNQQIHRQQLIADARSTKANPWFLGGFIDAPRDKGGAQ